MNSFIGGGRRRASFIILCIPFLIVMIDLIVSNSDSHSHLQRLIERDQEKVERLRQRRRSLKADGRYQAAAFLCDERLQRSAKEGEEVTAIEFGQVVRVCIEPTKYTSERGVVMRRIQDFKFTKDDTSVSQPLPQQQQEQPQSLSPQSPSPDEFITQQDVIVPNGRESAETLLQCDPGQFTCTFQTLLKPDFFITGGEITGTGEVHLEFEDNTPIDLINEKEENEDDNNWNPGLRGRHLQRQIQYVEPEVVYYDDDQFAGVATVRLYVPVLRSDAAAVAAQETPEVLSSTQWWQSLSTLQRVGLISGAGIVIGGLLFLGCYGLLYWYKVDRDGGKYVDGKFPKLVDVDARSHRPFFQRAARRFLPPARFYYDEENDPLVDPGAPPVKEKKKKLGIIKEKKKKAKVKTKKTSTPKTEETSPTASSTTPSKKKDTETKKRKKKQKNKKPDKKAKDQSVGEEDNRSIPWTEKADSSSHSHPQSFSSSTGYDNRLLPSHSGRFASSDRNKSDDFQIPLRYSSSRSNSNHSTAMASDQTSIDLSMEMTSSDDDAGISVDFFSHASSTEPQAVACGGKQKPHYVYGADTAASLDRSLGTIVSETSATASPSSSSTPKKAPGSFVSPQGAPISARTMATKASVSSCTAPKSSRTNNGDITPSISNVSKKAGRTSIFRRSLVKLDEWPSDDDTTDDESLGNLKRRGDDECSSSSDDDALDFYPNDYDVAFGAGTHTGTMVYEMVVRRHSNHATPFSTATYNIMTSELTGRTFYIKEAAGKIEFWRKATPEECQEEFEKSYNEQVAEHTKLQKLTSRK